MNQDFYTLFLKNNTFINTLNQHIIKLYEIYSNDHEMFEEKVKNIIKKNSEIKKIHYQVCEQSNCPVAFTVLPDTILNIKYIFKDDTLSSYISFHETNGKLLYNDDSFFIKKEFSEYKHHNNDPKEYKFLNNEITLVLNKYNLQLNSYSFYMENYNVDCSFNFKTKKAEFKSFIIEDFVTIQKEKSLLLEEYSELFFNIITKQKKITSEENDLFKLKNDRDIPKFHSIDVSEIISKSLVNEKKNFINKLFDNKK